MKEECSNPDHYYDKYLKKWLFHKIVFVAAILFLKNVGWLEWIPEYGQLMPSGKIAFVSAGFVMVAAYLGFQQWHSHYHVSHLRKSGRDFSHRVGEIDKRVTLSIHVISYWLIMYERCREGVKKVPAHKEGFEKHVAQLATISSKEIPVFSAALYDKVDLAIHTSFSTRNEDWYMYKRVSVELEARIFEAKRLLLLFGEGMKEFDRTKTKDEISVQLENIRELNVFFHSYTDLFQKRFLGNEIAQQWNWYWGIVFPYIYNHFFLENFDHQDKLEGLTERAMEKNDKFKFV